MSEQRQITAIQLQERRKDRYSIFLENEFAFGVHQDVLLKCGIAKGDRLSQEKIDEILLMEKKHAAREKAMRLLAHRARSKKELLDRLVRAGFAADISEQVIHDLERLKLLDDTEFAMMYARSRMVTKPVGEFLLRRELQQKGISESDIDKAVEEAYREKSEQELARELAAKNKKKQVQLDENKAKKRVADFLMRRGFHWDMVKDILNNWDQL